MSLALLQGYSSPEEDEGEEERLSSSSLSDGDDGEEEEAGEEDGLVGKNRSRKERKKPLSNPSRPSSNSLLPSALDAFAEVTGPPEFLNNRPGAVEETREALGVLDRMARDTARREKKDLPAGAVVEAKAQLVGIRDRVRSDVEGSHPSGSATKTVSDNGKRVFSAANPDAKDAADLLRICVQCGIPKTYSHARGMTCPVCGDRPPADPKKESEKQRGFTVKDKEKSKRMKGQSSHSTWKSETEMQLRQQYD
ncbi:uncharacterized protein LOC120106706 [Phoenix dactylifera]|uniref:Uncharacterized protein LOC120106706 n=1 Tax=Phoenix dactylifera TaxID=42345 RepID=A0A8B8ZVW8_PHODC|nr:uncharacterized protein LOC120106706 [Phoenix dactylifera]